MRRTSLAQRGRRFAVALSAMAIAAMGVVAAQPAAAATGDDPSMAVSIDQTSPEGLVLSIDGENYTDLPDAIGSDGTPKAAMGNYALVYDANATTIDEINETMSGLALGWVMPNQIKDGAWSRTFTVDPEDLTWDSDLKVITWPAHGIIDDNLINSFDLTLTDAQKTALGLEAPKPVTKVAVTSATADGLTVKVDGSDYTNLPSPTTGGPSQGIYAAVIDTTTTDYDDVNADTANALGTEYIYKGKIVGGKWSKDLQVSAKDITPASKLEVIIWSAHGNITDDTLVYAGALKLTDSQLDALFPKDTNEPEDTDEPEGSEEPGDIDEPATTDPQLKVSIAKATKKAGLVLDVKGTNYTNLPQAVGADGKQHNAMGTYALVYNAKTTTIAQINETMDGLALDWIMPNRIKNGAWSKTFTVNASDLAWDGDYKVITWPAHGVIKKNLINTTSITLTDAQKSALGLKKGETPQPKPAPVKPTPPKTEKDPDEGSNGPADPAKKSENKNTSQLNTALGTTADTGKNIVCTTKDVPATAGTPSLSWGVKSSFVSYIEGGIAKGSVSTAGGASRTGGGFAWGGGSGSLNASGLGTVSFPGSVHFTGHDGILNVTISNVKVQIKSAHTGQLIATVKSQDMEGNAIPTTTGAIANLNFSSVSAKGGSASATLTASGAKAFAGFYNAGERMDNVTVSVNGATAATTEQVCYDEQGNRVNEDGTAYAAGSSSLASTGVGTDTEGLVGLVAFLLAAGSAVLVARSRRERIAARR